MKTFWVPISLCKNHKVLKEWNIDKICWHTEDDLINLLKKKWWKIMRLSKYAKSNIKLPREERIIFYEIRKAVKKHWFDMVYGSIRSEEFEKINNVWLNNILEITDTKTILNIMNKKIYRLLLLNVKKWLSKREKKALKHLSILIKIYWYNGTVDKLNVFSVRKIKEKTKEILDYSSS